MSFETTDTSIATLCPSRVEGGTVHGQSDLACTKLAPVRKQAFKVSETVCVTAIDVNSTTDKLSMVLISCDPYNSAPKSKANRAVVLFVFPKGMLGKATPAKIEEVIGQTLSEGRSDASVKPGSPDRAPTADENAAKEDAGDSDHAKNNDAATPSNSGTNADGGRDKGDGSDTQAGSRQAATPPPAASDSAPADAAARISQVGKGQTIDQVTALLGQPLSITDLHSRVLYQYPKLQVFFVDGIVTEVH